MGVRPPLPPPSGYWRYFDRDVRLDIADPLTFEAWVIEGGTRTLQEFCQQEREWVSVIPVPPLTPRAVGIQAYEPVWPRR